MAGSRLGTIRMRWRAGAATSVALLMGACASGAPRVTSPAPEPAAPSAEQAAPIAQVRTEPEPQKPVGPELFGIDLDTVHAGPFDQGKMWTFEYPPIDYFQHEYGFRPDSAWFAKARLGALRIPGCSASFVSPNGLVMSNHHCAREFATQVQKKGENLLDSGFFARDLADERAVEDFHADQLIEIVDVTDEVNQQVDAAPEAQRADTRRKVLDEIKSRITEEHGGEDAGIMVEMISLYNGGRTSAYVFRRYTNAKLVALPELQIGFFGGDPDNFTYPRYNLDFSFFRIYGDDGKPLHTEPYFRFDRDGLHDGEPIFIVGNPGSTSRLQTVAELEFRRDVRDRGIVRLLRTRMAVLKRFIDEHPAEAEARDLRNTYFGFSNSEKAYSGQLKGLEDPVILARRADTERRFQEAIEADSALAGRYGDLIQRMAELQNRKREQAAGFGAFLALTSPYLSSATLHRALLAFQVISAKQGGAPRSAIDGLIEQVKKVPQQPASLDIGLMEARFGDFIEYYGKDSDLVRNVLGGRSPHEAAVAIHSASVLADSAQAVMMLADSTVRMNDPALSVVHAYLPVFSQFQRVVSQVFPQEGEISAQIGRARLAVYGTAVPPDATFSLRIADGRIKGYDYNGTKAPFQTTYYGLYNRHYSHAGEADWALPERWLHPPASFDLSVPLDFVSTADIIGGNSGSPVLDKDLEVVGLVFDGNIESLPGDYIYLPESNRAVSVDVAAILEALDDIYDADRLVLELTTGKLVPTEREADRVRR